MIYSGGLRPKSTKMDSVYFSFLVWHIAVLVGIFLVASACMYHLVGFGVPLQLTVIAKRVNTVELRPTFL